MTDEPEFPPEVNDFYDQVHDESMPRERVIFRDAKYALTPRAPIDHIVKGVLFVKSVNVWLGKFGSKKTWSVIDLAVCVGVGKDFLGIDTKQMRVLIIDEESGDTRLSMRLAAALRGEEAYEAAEISFISLAGFNLLKNPGDAKLLQLCIEEKQAGLVIIDALADIMLGGDENAVKDTQPVFAALRHIAEVTGAAILVIHHTNKAGDYRGSSAIPGAIDSMLEIKSDEGSDFIDFKSIKNRDGEPIRFSGRAHWDQDLFYMTKAEIPAKTEVLGKAQTYVMRYLEEHGASTVTAIMNSADTCTAASAKAAVYSLTSMGKLRRTNPGVPDRIPAVYEIVE